MFRSLSIWRLYRATKTTKRVITRDYDEGTMPDLFDVVYDTYSRDGFSIKACNRCLCDIQMRLYPQDARSFF